jgi:hypothetical protein
MKPLLKCLVRVNAIVFGGWMFVTPLGNDVKRPLREWSREWSFDTLQECESYRERQADEFIKRTGSSANKTYGDAAMRHLLGRCTVAEFFETH